MFASSVLDGEVDASGEMADSLVLGTNDARDSDPSSPGWEGSFLFFSFGFFPSDLNPPSMDSGEVEWAGPMA